MQRVYVRCYRDKQAFEEAFLNIFGLSAGRVVAYYIRGPDLYLRNGTCTNVRAFLRGRHTVYTAGAYAILLHEALHRQRVGNERVTTCFANEAVRWGALRFGFSEAQALRARNLALTYTRLFAPPGVLHGRSEMPRSGRAERVARPPRTMADAEQAQERVEQEEQEETLKQRLEREHGELIQELRALIPGAQVLLGFLLAIRFTRQFADLTDTQRASTTSPCCRRRLRSSSSSRLRASPSPVSRGRQGIPDDQGKPRGHCRLRRHLDRPHGRHLSGDGPRLGTVQATVVARRSSRSSRGSGGRSPFTACTSTAARVTLRLADSCRFRTCADG